jgi:D-aspartate ligase
MHPNVPVLILGGGETALGVLRAFTDCGVPTYVYAPRGNFVRFSRWYRSIPAPQRLCLRDLLKHVDERVVLCPCSDHAVEEVAALPAEDRDRFPACVPALEVLRRFTDKARFADMLERIDLPRPFTKAIACEEDLEQVPPEIFPNVILKPCDSIAFGERFGVKAFAAATLAEARRTWREARSFGLDVVVQEYIPGDAGNCYLIDGFIDRHGRLCGLLTRRKIRIYPRDFGNPSCQISVPVAEAAAAVADVISLMASVGYRGVFSALVKRDPRDGRFKILEVNARPYWYIGFTRHCGVDLTWMYYLDALGEPVPPARSFKVGRRCIYPYYDFYSVRPSCRAGEYSWWGWLRDVLGAWQPIFHVSDPMPAVSRGLAMLGARLKPLLPVARENNHRISKGRMILSRPKPIPQVP